MHQMNVTTESRFRLETSAPSPQLLPSLSDLAVDDALAASFPASDPPAWNSGVARLVPVETPTSNGFRLPAVLDGALAEAAGVVYVSRSSDSDWTLRTALVWVVLAAGIALLAPLAILLVGLPIALAVRGLLEVVLWSLSAMG